MNLPTPSSDISPLWIVALFVALSESMAGVAAIATDGASRLIFAIFAVSFPVVVLAAFLYLLIKHAFKLAGAGAFKEVSAEEYYRLTEGQRSTYREAAIKAGVEVVLANAGDEAGERADVEAQVAASFDLAVEAASITVDLQEFGQQDPLQVPVADDTTVDFLLDSVYFAIAPAVEPFTYGRDWALTNEHKRLSNMGMGTAWAKRNNRIRDDRLLAEVGISAGCQLTARRLGQPATERAPVLQHLDGLVAGLYERLSEEGMEVVRVTGNQRPRLLAFDGDVQYGLYAMAGKPKDQWIEFAQKASSRLGHDRGESVKPVLALDTRPTNRFRSLAEQCGVDVMWLTNGAIRNAPWGKTEDRQAAAR